MEPVLLWSYNHTRPHESHVGDALVGGKAMSVDKICANEAARSTKTSLAMDSNLLLLDGDHIVRHLDELPYKWQWRTGAIFEFHIVMSDANGGEVGGTVECGVQTDDKANFLRAKVGKYHLEGIW